MDTDLRIPVTSEQRQLLLEAAGQEPEGLTAWARAVLVQAAQEQIARRGSAAPSGHPDRPPVQGQGDFPEGRSREAEFRELAEQWRRETGMLSSVTKKVQHPAYRQIIAMGEEALPWVLRELRDRPASWFEALRAIARETPVPPEDRADPRRAREAWLRWGEERGLTAER